MDQLISLPNKTKQKPITNPQNRKKTKKLTPKPQKIRKIKSFYKDGLLYSKELHELDYSNFSLNYRDIFGA